MSTTAPEDGYFDLGSYSRPVSTNNPKAALWFNRGLIWTYGFNRDEAVLCFENAASADPNCAMAYWGIAYSSGAYYNKPWQFFDQKDLNSTLEKAVVAAGKALKLSGSASPLEQALIKAVQKRYAQASPEDLKLRDADYANAMEQVYQDFGDDLDVAALTVESFMNLTPWALFNPYTGEATPRSRTNEVGKIFEKAFQDGNAYQHAGLLHLYIHFIEMSREPEKGIKAANCLRNLCPDTGHMSHMPSHLDVLVGDYRAAILANQKALVADKKYLAKIGGYNMYSLYRVHDFQSLIYAAMLCGNFTTAIEATAELEESLPDDFLRIESPPMADWMEGYNGVRAHVLVRFGRWEDILRLQLPTDQDLYCVTTATTHYVQGVAHAALGNVEEAVKSQALFQQSFKKVPETRYDYPNKCVNELQVGQEMLAGEIEYRHGNYDQAFAHLRQSIEYDDNLIYSEPWGWMQPTRHAYAALLLEQGHVEEAAEAYATDLGFDSSLPRGHQHPNNIWALKGYHECLTKLGRLAEATMIEQPLKLAQAVADVPVVSSCFCRREAQPAQNGRKCR